MKSSQFVRSKLVNRTTADCSSSEVKNNRYHYFLKFEEDIGWDWVQGQIYKVAQDIDVELEIWKIQPSGVAAFEIEVREIERRENIDESQKGLSSFEE